MDLSRLTIGDRLLAGGGLVLFLASFGPWFRAEFQGHDAGDFNGWDVGFQWAGVPALLGIVAAGIVLATKLGSSELPELPITWGQVFLGAGALSALLVVAKLATGEEAPGYDVFRAWGLYVAALAAVAFAAGGYLTYRDEHRDAATRPPG